METKLDFSKICRVCLNEGVMMSVFKVNISKKLMACASVQVWQNDGLPAQICNNCSSKLHISVQFKKQCEKSDAKLRQYISNEKEVKEEAQDDYEETEIQQIEQVTDSTENCIYIKCTPLTDLLNEETKLTDPLANITEPRPFNTIQNQVITTEMHITNQQQQIIHSQQPQQIIQAQLQVNNQEENYIKDKKINFKLNKDKGTDQNRQCSTCNKIFSTKSKLTRHMKIHSSDMPYKCNICSKAFLHNGNYKVHLRMHTGERPFRCTVCDKGCRQAQDLEKHMRTHTGERPHRCTMCTKAFTSSSNLIAHIRTHTNDRPYVCCVCQRAFRQSNELTKHMRTHTGEKPHVCDICHKGFNGSHKLKVHRRSHTEQSTCLSNMQQ